MQTRTLVSTLGYTIEVEGERMGGQSNQGTPDVPHGDQPAHLEVMVHMAVMHLEAQGCHKLTCNYYYNLQM